MITGRHHRPAAAGRLPTAGHVGGVRDVTGAAPPVLAVTADPVLADAVRRLAAAAAVAVHVVDDLPDVASWQGCDLALVGADLARRMASGRLRAAPTWCWSRPTRTTARSGSSRSAWAPSR